MLGWLRYWMIELSVEAAWLIVDVLI